MAGWSYRDGFSGALAAGCSMAARARGSARVRFGANHATQ
jgi:hypothetical protein